MDDERPADGGAFAAMGMDSARSVLGSARRLPSRGAAGVVSTRIRTGVVIRAPVLGGGRARSGLRGCDGRIHVRDRLVDDRLDRAVERGALGHGDPALLLRLAR